MRRQIGIAAALTVAAAIAGVPVQPRASLIQTAAWIVPTNAAVETAVDTPMVALAGGGSLVDLVFLNTDIAGGVTLLPATMFAPSVPAEVASRAERRAIADNRRCDTTDCAAAEPMPFAVGTAAFQVESFIDNAVAAARFISDSHGGTDLAPGAYTTLGMVGIGNFALVAAGLIGLGLTRRRDYIPPG